MEQTKFSPPRSSGSKKMAVSLYAAIAAAMLLLAIAACNSNNADSNKAADYATRSNASFSMRQQIFCLNLLSGMNSLYPFHEYRHVLDSTISGINTVLRSSQITPMIGHWRCVWGPAIYTNHKVVSVDSGQNYTTANTMFMAQNLDSPSLYVIAIAGTNGASLFDWEREDFYLDATNDLLSGGFYPWALILKGQYVPADSLPSRTTMKSEACVTYGIHIGLDKLLHMKDTTQPGSPTLLQFLDKITSPDTLAPLNIWVTGHSLGAVLSPVMALYLNDTKGKKWGRRAGNIGLSVLATAGFTPGDDTFSVYYNSRLGNSTTRVYNTMDIAHDCFNSSSLAAIPGIYAGFNLDSLNGLPFPVDSEINGKKVGTLFTELQVDCSLYGYAQLYPSIIDSFTSGYYGMANMGPGALNPDNFLQQVVTQHTSPYAAYFGVDTFLQVVSNIMHFQPCYFTNGYTPASITVYTSTTSPAKK